MLYVSMVELFAQSKETLSAALGGSGYPIAVLSFFGGMLAIAVIDRLVPEYENPHEMTYLDGAGEDELAANSSKMMRMGLITALAITIHNFPEGMATFVSALQGRNWHFPSPWPSPSTISPRRCRGSADLLRHPGPEKGVLVFSCSRGFRSPSAPFSAICCCVRS